MKQVFVLFFAFLFLNSQILAQTILKGFEYENVSAPDGKEWESPERLSLNKEQPKAYFFSFQNMDAARKVLPENSSYWKSLNGEWKFHFAKTPDARPKNFFRLDYDVSSWDNLAVPSSWNIQGIQKDGSLKYGVPIYVNQPVIFQHKVAVDDWRGGVMRQPPKTWTTYEYRNEVGSFVREFDVPQSWNGRNIFLSFDGVDNFFYLWVNGKYVGFSKNSRNAATFNISQFLRPGKNKLAVEVYRNSDASYLEAQDMFRLPGIFRTVAIYSTPKLHVRDLVVIPDLDSDYRNGSLNITSTIRNLSGKTAKGNKIIYSLYENKLYSDENTKVSEAVATTTVPTVYNGKEIQSVTTLKVTNPKKWSAEFPHRYTLVAELKDAQNRTIETISTYTGFRKVELKDTKAEDDEFGLAGRYYYLNGKTVKLKGVNRHETNPAVGHAITREQMKEEVMIMKRGNINHVRNAHYPDDPYWYYLCDKYGLYLEDEANIESHQYYYGEASLSHPPEWEAAHVARVMEMAHATVNNPSIVIWSLGNEAGPGKNFVTAYNALKKFDDSRPVQYERNNSIVDIGSNQYPSIAWMRGAVTGKYNIKYPFHVSEYAHSMGNACGNLADYWEAIESTNFFMGGAIWDWIDQAMYNYTEDGKRYLAYGGDFGDTPNDGQFVMNGLIFADMEPKPQYYEVKKVYQYMGAAAVDVKKGLFEIFNKYYFKDLSDYEIKWFLYENGKSIKEGIVNTPTLKARDTATIQLSYNFAELKDQSEYFVKIQFLTKFTSAWAPAGFVEAEEQIPVKEAVNVPYLKTVAKAATKPQTSSFDNNSSFVTITGEKFAVQFDLSKGTIHSLTYGNEKVIEDGNGPELYALRAFVNNDNWVYEKWYEHGLHNLQHKPLNFHFDPHQDGTITLAFTVESQAPNAAKIHGGWSSGKNRVEELTDKKFGADDFKFTTNQIWTIYPDGSIELQSSIVSNNTALVLPRLGYQLKIPEKYSNFTYYGRGPIDNYADRKSGQFVELHTSKVADQFVNFPKPQNMGNHEDVRWAALTDNAGNGAIFISNGTMSASALQYNSLDMTLSSHIHKLPEAGDTYLNLDIGVTGLGGNSCGQGAPLEQDRVNAGPHTIGFIIRPTEGKNLSSTASVKPSGIVPLMISRSSAGEVSVISQQGTSDIMYSINNGQPQNYTSSFNLRNGGVVNAWYKNYPKLKVEQNFSKIETVPLTVINASSQEAGEGNASNLVDGNPSSIWHTMYSVTVAQYPHWVDLDAAEVKTIKGFSYLPRSGGGNGNIKDFSIHISMDGENWGEPIIKSSFANNAELKKIIFDKPVKARYIRFTALSEQRGQDFASGAELSIYAE